MVHKSAEQLEKERTTALSDLYPYYKFSEEMEKQSRDKISNSLEKAYITYQKALRAIDSTFVFKPSDSIRYVNLAKEVLDSIYGRGVLSMQPEHLNPEAGRTIFRLRRGNTVSPENAPDFMNLMDACEKVERMIEGKNDSTLNFLKSIICRNIKANLVYDSEYSEKEKQGILDAISPTSGMVQKGEVVIVQGTRITPEKRQILESLKSAYDTQGTDEALHNNHFLDPYMRSMGRYLVSMLVFAVFTIFLRLFLPHVFKSLRRLSFVLATVVSFCAITQIAVNFQQVSDSDLSLYVLPFCMVPIVVKNFFSNRLALLVHLVIIMLTGFILPLGYEFMFLHLIAGLVAILSNVRTRYWSGFFMSTALIFLTYAIGYLGISFLHEANIQSIKWNTFGWLALNALLTLLAYPLIPIFEKVFGIISDITLVELSDVNRPLLKELSRKAPGTFWHSMQVANLAEAACTEVGANALLAKTGALYHDIGKMKRPVYFIENQKTAINPHDDLQFIQSARIIREHVTYGIELAKKNTLPNILIDFIRTHHGTTRIEYFFRQYVKQNPDKEPDDDAFCYPGPLPYSKETAIVMMADSVEAASRSLKNPDEEDISKLVDGIIQSKITQNQFLHCDLSFKDISTVKKTFKKQLRSIYHIRISYPKAIGEGTAAKPETPAAKQ